MLTQRYLHLGLSNKLNGAPRIENLILLGEILTLLTLVRVIPQTSVKLGLHFLCFMQYFVSKHFVQLTNADTSLIKISYHLLN